MGFPLPPPTLTVTERACAVVTLDWPGVTVTVGVIAFTVTRFDVPVIEELLSSVAVSVYMPTVVSFAFTVAVPLLSAMVASTVDDPVMVILTASLSLSTVLPYASCAVTITEDDAPAVTGLVALTANFIDAP